jgi:uncharacterized protein (TIGR01777 family)
MRVAVTGATGLVGRSLLERLLARGDEVSALSRDPERARDGLPGGTDAARFLVGDAALAREALAGTDAVVNLAGEPVLGRRWNDGVREEIRASRVEGTQTLVGAMRDLDPRPCVLVNASAVGFYGPRGEEEVDEDEAPGDDFLAGVCVAWEAAAREAEALGVRVVTVRIGIVLSRDGGALPRMLPPFRWFVGGRIGNGKQGFPWIHIDDLVGILLHALDREEVSGPLNGAAPGVVTNGAFCRALGRAIGRPSWLPVPRPALRLLLGPAAAVLAAGQRAVPARTLRTGYVFRFPAVDAALADLFAD